MKVNVRKRFIKHIRMCGFRKRMRTKGGRAILKEKKKDWQKTTTRCLRD